MTDGETTNPVGDAATQMRNQWGWILAFGLLMIVLGAVGLTMLFAFTIASVLYFGAFLLIAAGVQIVDMFKHRNWRSLLWHGITALLYLVAGVLIFANPALASASLTLLLAATLIAIGVARVVIALGMRPLPAWGWMLFSGLVSAALGGMILIGWPAASAWVIGLFVAIELIFYGWATVMLAFAAKAAPKEHYHGRHRIA